MEDPKYPPDHDPDDGLEDSDESDGDDSDCGA